MSEILACLQLGALLWIAIGIVLGRIQARRAKRGEGVRG
jgi:hypothetical protein